MSRSSVSFRFLLVLVVLGSWPIVGLAAEPPVEASQAAAQSERPRRQGFTLELGIGGAVTMVTRDVSTVRACFGSGCPSTGPMSSSSSKTDVYGGLAPLSLGIGGFVSPELALLFRLTGSSYFKGGDQWVNTLYGGVLQYWPSDRVFVSAGGGVAVFANNAFYSGSASSSRTGFGFSARAGVAVANFTHHTLRFAVEAVPAFYEGDRRVIGTTLVFEWQYF